MGSSGDSNETGGRCGDGRSGVRGGGDCCDQHHDYDVYDDNTESMDGSHSWSHNTQHQKQLSRPLSIDVQVFYQAEEQFCRTMADPIQTKINETFGCILTNKRALAWFFGCEVKPENDQQEGFVQTTMFASIWFTNQW